MASCKDCINYDVCSTKGTNCDRANHCEMFKDRTRFVELPSSNLPINIYLSDSSDNIDKTFVLRNYSYEAGNGIYMVIQCIETQEYFFRGLNEYGKTVFLTREEAEKALEE